MDVFSDGIADDFELHISATLRQTIPHAVEAAPGTAAKWSGLPISGGLYYWTYKAACQRGGAFTGRHDSAEFNEDLADLLKSSLLRPWHKVFTRLVPKKFERLGKDLEKAFNLFHESTMESGRADGVQATAMAVLEQQMSAHKLSLQAATTTGQNIIDKLQREANRSLKSGIATQMSSTYQECVDETGA